MPQPTRGDVHVNAPLTNISIAYIQNSRNFIADRFFPNIPVSKQSDRYYTYDRGDFNRDEMKRRAPGTESAGGGYALDNTPTYYCPVWAYHKDVDDQVRANSDSVLGPDRDATIFVSQKALIRRERSFAANALVTGVWTNEKTGVNSDVNAATEFLIWNDANSDPITDIRTAKRTVLELTGFEPNKLALGKAVYDALVDHPDLVDRVKYGQTPGAPAEVNASSLAQLFDLDEVLVSKAIHNSAAKNATESSAFISGNHALLAYVAPNPGIMIPSAGYTFSWNGWMGASSMGHRIKRFRMEHLESDRVEAQMAFDHNIVAADCGYFFENAADFDAVVSI
jgi:hypothetical protein